MSIEPIFFETALLNRQKADLAEKIADLEFQERHLRRNLEDMLRELKQVEAQLAKIES